MVPLKPFLNGDSCSGDGAPGEGPVISYGSGLGVGWHSHRIGDVVLREAGATLGFCSIAMYVNARVPDRRPECVPTCLPTWPRQLSLRPDLSGERRH